MSPKNPKSETKNVSNKSKNNNQSHTWVLAFTNVVSKIGIPGFIVVAFSAYIFEYASIDQKRELIDKWLLFKNNNNSQQFSITIVIFAILIYIMEAYAFYRIRKLDRDEISRLAEFKKLYQEQQLGKSLPGS